MFSINYRKVEGAVYYYNFLLNNSAIQSKFQLTLRTKAFFFQNFVRSNIIKVFFRIGLSVFRFSPFIYKLEHAMIL